MKAKYHCISKQERRLLFIKMVSASGHNMSHAERNKKCLINRQLKDTGFEGLNFPDEPYERLVKLVNTDWMKFASELLRK